MRFALIAKKYKTNFLRSSTNVDYLKQILASSCIYLQQGFRMIYILSRFEKVRSSHRRPAPLIKRVPGVFLHTFKINPEAILNMFLQLLLLQKTVTTRHNTRQQGTRWIKHETTRHITSTTWHSVSAKRHNVK